MAMSIMEKITTLGAAAIHRLLDQGMDAMPIEILRQHARRLEEAKEQVADDTAVAEGKANQLANQIREKKAAVSTTKEMIDLLLSDDDTSNDSKAEPLAAKLVTLEGDIQRLSADHEEAETTAAALNANLKQIEKVHRTALDRIATLTAMEHSARAKEAAAEALGRANRLAGDASEVSIDDVAGRVQERSAIADAKLKRAMGKVVDDDDPEIAVTASKARDYLAERRAALAAQKTATPVAE